MPLLKSDMVNSRDCIRAFERMFWAFLFLIDFRIGTGNVQVDVLPDFIGWLLFASAFGWIIKLHSDIRGLRTLSSWLAFLSILDMVQIREEAHGPFEMPGWAYLLLLVGIVGFVLGLIVIWRLCGVIMDMATAVGDVTIRNRADFRRRFYVGLTVAAWLAIGLCFVMPVAEFVVPVAIVGLVFCIVVICLMMGLMRGTANMCRAGLA